MRDRSEPPPAADGTNAAARGVAVATVVSAVRRHPWLAVYAVAVVVLLPVLHLVGAWVSGLEAVGGTILVLVLLVALLLTEARQLAARRIAEATLAVSERRFRQMADQGQDISFRYRLDPPGFEYVSPSWRQVTGMAPEMVMADRDAALSLIEPDDLPRLADLMRNGTDPEHPVVIRVRPVDSGRRYAEFQATVLRDASGVATHTVGTGRDVTERVLAEQARLEAEARYRLLTEQSQDVVFDWHHGPTPGFSYLSPAFETVSGRSIEDALAGRIDASTIIEGDDLGLLEAALRDGTTAGHPVLVRFRRPDGTLRTMELAATVIPATDGAPARTIGAARDVTERVEAERRLQASELRFREMADRSQDIIFRYQLRPEPGFVYVSQSIERIARGQGVSAFIGDPTLLERTVHSEDRYLLASLLTSTVPTEDPVTIRWIDVDGRVTWVEVTVVPVLGDDGFPDAIDGVARVVTDRVMAQQALATSEERFRLLAERSRDVILRYRIRPTPGIDYVSPSIEAMTGYSAAAVLEHPEVFLSHFAPEDLERLYGVVLGGTPPGEPALVRWAPPDRAAATWEISAVAVRDRSGTIVATECVARDATIRVAAQQALARSEGRFREMLGNLELLAIIVDADGRCVFANPAAARLAGAAADALVGQDLIHLLAPPQFADQARGYLAALFAGMPADRRDLSIAAADGTEHIVVWDAFVLHDADGHASALAAIGEDVTDARRAAADRDRLMAVTERSHDALAIIDADGSVGYANPAMLARIGWPAEAIVGRTAEQVLPGGLGVPWPMPADGGGGVWHAERRSGAEDALVIEELMVTPITGDDGAVAHHVVEVWDVSRVRELEWAVDQATRERAVVSTALLHLDSSARPEVTADAITRELRAMPGVDAAAIMAFELPAGGKVVAVHGMAGVRAGDEAPARAIAHIREQLAHGPFAERWTERHPHSIAEDSGLPIRAVACGPLLADGVLVGLLMLASTDAEQHRRFQSDLGSVAEFSAMAGVLVGPALRQRQEHALTRIRLQRIIDEQRFDVCYQPIVDIASGTVLGHEATTRFLDDLEPVATIEAAISVGLSPALEIALVGAAVERSRPLPDGQWLAINVTPSMLLALAAAGPAPDAGRPLVLELSEHQIIGDYGPVRDALAALGPGVCLAIDDTGAGQANLAHLVELTPRYVKLDVSLVRGVDQDVTRQAMARGILQFSTATGSTVIAEGVETRAELDALRRLGVTVAQGHLLGRPRAADGSADCSGT